MKRAGMTLLSVVLIVATLHAFRAMQMANIRGRLAQPAEVISVLATNGIDSVGASTADGFFTLSVRPGNWKVLVKAKEPHRNVILNVPVYEATTINLGSIRLQ